MKNIACCEYGTEISKFKMTVLKYIPVLVLSFLGIGCKECGSKFNYKIIKPKIVQQRYLNQAKREMTMAIFRRGHIKF